MNLSVIEDHLLRALQRLLEGSVDLYSGPAHGGPASGMRAELFVHAARYSDLGGSTSDGAHVGRRPVALDDGASGFSEARAAIVDIEVTCHCAQHAQAHALMGLVVAPLLEALETLQGASLGDPGNPHQRLWSTDHTASLHACTSRREAYDGIAVAQVLLTLRLQGYLHVQLVRRGGLHKKSPYDLPLRLTLRERTCSANTR